MPGSRQAPGALQALSDAAAGLWDHCHDVPWLREMAEAAGTCDLEEIELRYLMAARDAAPGDAQTLRMLARALTRQGRFEEAAGRWLGVLEIVPGDAEAEQAAADLRGIAETAQDVAGQIAATAKPSDGEALLRQARAMRSAGQFASAEGYFAEAQAALGSDLKVLEEREHLRLAHSEGRLEIARRRAACDPHVKAQSLVQRMEREHERLEIEVLNIRVERMPGDWGLRVALARRLKQTGNFSGAVQRLEEARREAGNRPEVLIELGECWQHLRQFEKALEFYRQAIGAAQPAEADRELLQLARYRGAVLAAALSHVDEARRELAAIVASDPTYKDARERLDKLDAN